MESKDMQIRCNLIIFKEALLGKWWWRFMNKTEKLWRMAVELK